MRSVWTKSVAVTLVSAGVWLHGALPRPALAHDDERAPEVFNVRFPGGTLGELAGALRTAAPGSNVVVMPPADRLRAPAMELVSVDVEATLRALDDQYQIIDGVMHDHNVSTGHGESDTARAVYMITALPRGAEQTTGVWTLAEAISVGARPEDIVTAVQAALSFAGEQAEIKYHPETRLLMARASESTVEVIEEVIDRTRQGFEAQREREEESQIIEMEAEVQMLRLEIERLRNENTELRGRPGGGAR